MSEVLSSADAVCNEALCLARLPYSHPVHLWLAVSLSHDVTGLTGRILCKTQDVDEVKARTYQTRYESASHYLDIQQPDSWHASAWLYRPQMPKQTWSKSKDLDCMA